ncbi:MAG: 3-phosphoshikimate 1-carboxyvinyltransferase [bacterium]|nr:3-phosphoshikimate 1-carboxyvinyltransferase [bacterium]
MNQRLDPARKIGGTITVPGDKSIAHRAALLSILSSGPVEVTNFPDSVDCHTSLKAAEVMGVRVNREDDKLLLIPPATIELPPETIVDCGNSGTTARLLSGIVAGREMELTLVGDESLQSRPMKRIIDPLTEMGAEFFSEDGKMPLRIKGHKLLPFEYRLPVASAQVKSAVLLAGLASNCTVAVQEESLTRDHTELMLQHLGEGVEIRKISPVPVQDPLDPRKKKMQMPEPFKRETRLTSQTRLTGGSVDIPGDMSTAAFFLAAAAISGETITVENVGLNPTRTSFLDYLKLIGCKVSIGKKEVISGEARGSVTVTGGKLNHRKIFGEMTVGLIDEIPIISVIAAFASGTTVIRDAAELRVKESDRLEAVADNLKRMGVKHGVLADGIAVEGGREFSGADFVSQGDHRIAMAFSIASLFLVGPSTIDDAACVSISCPTFYDLLDQIKQ